MSPSQMTTFLTGISVGVTLGIVLAPSRGAETWERIRVYSGAARERGWPVWMQAQTRGKAAATRAQQGVHDTMDKVRDHVAHLIAPSENTGIVQPDRNDGAAGNEASTSQRDG